MFFGIPERVFPTCWASVVAAFKRGEEACGVIVAPGEDGKEWLAWPAVNVAQDPANFWMFDNESTEFVESMTEEGRRVIVYHSHLGSEGWSREDIIDARLHEYEAVLFLPKTGEMRYFNPTKIAAYEGREWNAYASNCATLISDFMKKEFDIETVQWVMESETPWENPGWNAYEEQLEENGFERLEDPSSQWQKGDVLLMRIGKTHNPNHGAVVYDSQECLMLHHLIYKTSVIESWYKYIHHVVSVWRHRDVEQH